MAAPSYEDLNAALAAILHASGQAHEKSGLLHDQIHILHIEPSAPRSRSLFKVSVLDGAATEFFFSNHLTRTLLIGLVSKTLDATSANHQEFKRDLRGSPPNAVLVIKRVKTIEKPSTEEGMKALLKALESEGVTAIKDFTRDALEVYAYTTEGTRYSVSSVKLDADGVMRLQANDLLPELMTQGPFVPYSQEHQEASKLLRQALSGHDTKLAADLQGMRQYAGLAERGWGRHVFGESETMSGEGLSAHVAPGASFNDGHEAVPDVGAGADGTDPALDEILDPYDADARDGLAAMRMH